MLFEGVQPGLEELAKSIVVVGRSTLEFVLDAFHENRATIFGFERREERVAGFIPRIQLLLLEYELHVVIAGNADVERGKTVALELLAKVLDCSLFDRRHIDDDILKMQVGYGGRVKAR